MKTVKNGAHEHCSQLSLKRTTTFAIMFEKCQRRQKHQQHCRQYLQRKAITNKLKTTKTIIKKTSMASMCERT